MGAAALPALRIVACIRFALMRRRASLSGDGRKRPGTVTGRRLCGETAMSMKPLLGLAALAVALGASAGHAAPPRADPAPGSHFNDCGANCPEMVVIPAGTFRMGAPGGEEGRPEGPVHEVRIARPFALAAREVSNAEYAAFVAATAREPSRGCRSLNRAAGTVTVNPDADFRAPGEGAGDGAPQMPVVCVSWRDASAYAAWLRERTGQPYRLPSEAEWEYAARAGSQTGYPWGDSAAEGCAHANVFDLDGAGGTTAVFGGQGGNAAPASAPCHDGHVGAAPVGSYAANAFGLYDMTGNVWEWTQDCYEAPYAAAVPTDGSAYEVAGECSRRSVRGGSWITVPFRNRTAWRGRDPETLVSWIFGFRVARDVVPAR